MHRISLLAFFFVSSSAVVTTAQPKVNDDRLKIELFAESPDIVTPIGIDVDEKGRVYVLESHTHFPPQNYSGPKTDRIRVYEDLNGDRKADRITHFHTGETHTMSIALYRDGSLYVATRKEIFRLRDTNNDGIADDRTSLVKLDTKGNYPHNGLSGFAFDFKGDVHFGFGENLGEPYKLIGSDNTTLEGGGEGGNIYVCDKDGKKLRRVATGFWNPFHLCFDAFGRLFAVDNDPDGRPPCRLLHIVEGGDYGYRFRYGRKGLHPFTSWNGEIPGTLPMVAGTGEAPSGMLAYESDNLPDDYLGNLLVTSWGDHRIERYRLKPNGASFTSRMEPVITGDQNFRPVGIALAPDGSLYVSDWVDKSYNIHGKGRMWRISAKDEKKVERPDPVKEPEKAILSKHRPTREKAVQHWSSVDSLRQLALDSKTDVRSRFPAALMLLLQGKIDEQTAVALSKASPELAALFAPLLGDQALDMMDIHHETDAGPICLSLLLDLRAAKMRSDSDFSGFMLAVNDPFVQSAARRHAVSAPWVKKHYGGKGIDPARLDGKQIDDIRRLFEGTVLIQRHSGVAEFRDFIARYLDGADVDIRFLAIQWIAEEKLVQYRPQLTDSLARPDLTPRLLVATLTALDMLDGGKPQSADHVGGRWYLEKLVFGEKTPASTRAMALRMLPADNPALKAEPLKKLLEVEDERFRIEVVRTLRQSPIKERSAMLREIVNDEKQHAQVRAEAVAGLDANEAEELKILVTLAQGKDESLKTESLRALRGVTVENVETKVTLTGRPQDEDIKAWLGFIDDATPQAADVANGERVFFSAKAGGCFRCHTVGGRGGEAGPDLSTIGKSSPRERLLESILQPSKEIAPRYAAQLVELSDGEKLTLIYVGPSPDGKQIWADANGKMQLIEPGAIESKSPLTTSIMPTGLNQAMTATEMRDLLAFLESLK